MIIGSHVSFAKEGLLGCVKQTIEYNANTFMFYTGAPQNTIRKNIDINNTNEAILLMQEHNIDINNVTSKDNSLIAFIKIDFEMNITYFLLKQKSMHLSQPNQEQAEQHFLSPYSVTAREYP